MSTERTAYRPLCLWPLALGMSLGALLLLSLVSDVENVFTTWFTQMMTLGVVWITHRRKS